MLQPKQRISTFRSGVKKVTDSNVDGYYHLSSKIEDDCMDYVAWLLEHMRYMYPFTYEVSQALLAAPSIPPLMSASSE